LSNLLTDLLIYLFAVSYDQLQVDRLSSARIGFVHQTVDPVKETYEAQYSWSGASFGLDVQWAPKVRGCRRRKMDGKRPPIAVFSRGADVSNFQSRSITSHNIHFSSRSDSPAMTLS